MAGTRKILREREESRARFWHAVSVNVVRVQSRIVGLSQASCM